MVNKMVELTVKFARYQAGIEGVAATGRQLSIGILFPHMALLIFYIYLSLQCVHAHVW